MKKLTVLCAAALAALSTQAAAVGSLADVTVFDRAENRQLPIYWHEGRAYVVGKPGNEYALRVRNPGREEVLAVISVDGVNVVTGETANPQQSGYVLPAWRPLELNGWRKDLSRTAAFYFTPLPDSYAARTGRPDHVGVIGVAVFRKKSPPAEISRIAPLPAPMPFSRSDAANESRDSASAGAPASEPAPAQGQARAERQESARAEAQDSARAQAPAAKLGTGHGRSETSHARYVSFERATPEPAEVVSIYYDSYRNLLARGVIKGPRPLPHPHPFPGFVPDPGA